MLCFLLLAQKLLKNTIIECILFLNGICKNSEAGFFVNLLKVIQVKNELFGWRISSGKSYIDCQSEAEAEYLKIWLEAGLEDVKVPKDKSYISKILPELKALKEKIDELISDHISSITSQKLQNKILQKLQGELFN